MDELQKLEEQIYKKFKNTLVFLAPLAVDLEVTSTLIKANRIFRKKIKNPRNQELIIKFNQIISKLSSDIEEPLILELAKKHIDKNYYKFLFSLHKLHQIRWQKNLKKYGYYAIKFFIPEFTYSKNPDQYKLKKSYKINMPYALKRDASGYFDIKETRLYEQNFHLINSRLSFLSIRPNKQEAFANMLLNFPDWAFFVIHHQEDIIALAGEILQRVYDSQIRFCFNQLQNNILPKQAKINSNSYIKDIVKHRKLEELIVFRYDVPLTLKTYILEQLVNINIKNKNLKKETLLDFYDHILHVLKEFITKDNLKSQSLYDINIKKASIEEQKRSFTDYTLTVSLILDSGNKLSSVKEYYSIELSNTSIYNLVYLATNKLKYKYYYL